MERFVFELTYRDRSATLIVREGSSPDEFIALARTDPRTRRAGGALRRAEARHGRARHGAAGRGGLRRGRPALREDGTTMRSGRLAAVASWLCGADPGGPRDRRRARAALRRSHGVRRRRLRRSRRRDARQAGRAYDDRAPDQQRDHPRPAGSAGRPAARRARGTGGRRDGRVPVAGARRRAQRAPLGLRSRREQRRARRRRRGAARLRGAGPVTDLRSQDPATDASSARRGVRRDGGGRPASPAARRAGPRRALGAPGGGTRVRPARAGDRLGPPHRGPAARRRRRGRRRAAGAVRRAWTSTDLRARHRRGDAAGRPGNLDEAVGGVQPRALRGGRRRGAGRRVGPAPGARCCQRCAASPRAPPARR